MDFEGEGLLALWNGADTERAAEYNLWHSREHVPERMSVPGMLSARRYVRLTGTLPEYLSLYAVRDLKVLTSEPYLKLLNTPTKWSSSMRPSFRGFIRVCCTRIASFGGGLGSAVLALPITTDKDLSDRTVTALVERIVRDAGSIFAVHLLRESREVPPVPFKIGGDEDRPPALSGAILLESYDADQAAFEWDRWRLRFTEIGLVEPSTEPSSYQLAYALNNRSLQHIVPLQIKDYRRV